MSNVYVLNENDWSIGLVAFPGDNKPSVGTGVGYWGAVGGFYSTHLTVIEQLRLDMMQKRVDLWRESAKHFQDKANDLAALRAASLLSS